MINESIIVGLVIGVGVSVVGTLVSHFVRKREMDRLWAEEERRRKSDRRRELYERDLKIVGDSVFGIEEAMGALVWGNGKKGLVVNLIREAFLMQVKSLIVAISLEDEDLRKIYDELSDGYGRWLSLIDTGTGKPKKRRAKESREAAQQTHEAAAKVFRRIREILEEV